MSGIRDKFEKLFAARGGIEVSLEMECLLEAMGEPATKKDEVPAAEEKIGSRKWKAVHRGNGRYDVSDENGTLADGGDNLPKKEADALVKSLNGE